MAYIYVEGLLNTENTRKHIESGLATEGPIDIFNENEVSDQLGNMGLDKPQGQTTYLSKLLKY